MTETHFEKSFKVKTLYYKYSLNKDWSIRYHLIYKDKKEYQNQWILKSHSLREHILITRKLADEYIEKYSSSSRLILGFYYIGNYRKIEISNLGELFFYIDKEKGYELSDTNL